MGQVVPFIARVRDSGDWSATERARLQELADRLSAGGVKVEVIFGATDEGDPWCVVTDPDGDVLIHVARIGGVFVVHSAVDDAVSEDGDLHAALRERLAVTEDAIAPTSATILPFGASARQGQSFLALIIATAFFYETAAVGDSAEAGELPAAPTPAADDLPPPAADADAPAQERQLAAQGATLAGPEPAVAPVLVATAGVTVTAEPSSGPELAPPEPPAAPMTPGTAASAPEPEAVRPVVIEGSSGADLLVGTTADERILGGAGDDTLIGGGGHDTLEGGAGDDRIEVNVDVVAAGGLGADTFVIAGPVHLGHAETLLGVILDFSTLEGDRLVTLGGRLVHPLRPMPLTDGSAPGAEGDFGLTSLAPPTLAPPMLTPPTLAPPPGPLGPGNDGFTVQGGTPPGVPLTRIEVDLDGDGVADGYLLVGRAPDGAPPIAITGQSLGAPDPFG